MPFRIGHRVLTAEIGLIAGNGRIEPFDQRNFVPEREQIGSHASNHFSPGTGKVGFSENRLSAVLFGVDKRVLFPLIVIFCTDPFHIVLELFIASEHDMQP